MADVKTLRIFVSSPGDVSEERVLAERVLRRLGEEYRESVRFEIVLWEHEPIFAHTGFQEQIERPSQCDLVICILWSRLGTRLPEGFGLNPGGIAPTGTEFEVNDALEAYQRAGKPNLLIYRKIAAPHLNLASAEARERLRQYELLDEFCRRAFYDEQGTVIVAHHSYTESHEFEKRLVEHVRKWLERQAGTAASRPRWTSGSPYRGLQAFQAEHREIFFGRSQALSDLIGRLRDTETRAASTESVTRFLLVQGMSGVGKSSLIRAGLLPLLEGRAIEGIGFWQQVILKPSDRSDQSTDATLIGALAGALGKTMPAVRQSYPDTTPLAERLRNAPGESAARLDGYLAQEAMRVGLRPDQIRLVVFIDQLEELFEQSLEQAERNACIAILYALAREGRIWVVATVRSDFAPRMEEHPELLTLASEGHLHILGPPQSDELAEMIREPAVAAGLQWEVRDGVSLDQAILREATASPESLPLLEYALDQLYELRNGRRLTYAAYEELGGLKGGIARSAEAVLINQPNIPSSFPRLMRSLVSVDESGAAMRRYAPLSEFVDGTPQRALLEALIARRLCVADQRGEGAVASFAHEALIQSWPRVATWLQLEAGLMQARELAQRETRLWQQHGESDAWLATADKLMAFKALEAAEIALPAPTRTFIERSSRRVRRTTRIKQAAVCLIALLAIAASIGAWIATKKEREAEYQTAQTSKAQMRLLTEAAAERLKDGDFAFARGVILEVLRNGTSLSQPDAAAVNVFQEIRASDPARAVLAGHEGPVRRAAYSPDGMHIVTASFDGTARIWDTRTGIELMTLSGHSGAVFSATYAPDGARIVTASGDHTARIWDARTGSQLLVLSDAESLTCAVYSPDGSRIATVSERSVRIWDAHTGAALSAFSLPGVRFGSPHGDAGYRGSAAYSPDGKRIVTTMDDRTARIWDVHTGTVVTILSGHTDAIATATYSPDGKRIVTAGDRTARVWDAATGRQLLVISGHVGYVWSAAYSPDGRTIATASVDKTARIWDAMTGAPLKVLSGHINILCGAAYSPDGSSLVTAGWDRTARTWDLRDGAQAAILLQHDDQVGGVAFSPDSSHIVTSSMDRTVRIWDIRTHAQIAVLRAEHDAFNSAAYSPDGAHIVTTSDDKSARIWDARTGVSLAVLTGPAEVLSAAYSPDGQRLVASFRNLTFGVWDTRTGALGAVRSGHRDTVASAVFSPDGTKILTASVDKTARIWDAKTLAPLIVLPHSDFVNTAEFSRDGTRILTAENDSTARIWDARTGKQIGVLSGHRSSVYSAAFSADGNRIVTGSSDRTVRIWDAHKAIQLAVFTGHSADIQRVAFSPNGALVASASEDKTVRIWDAAVGADFPTQVVWEEAAEADALPDVQRTHLGLAPATALLADATIKSYASETLHSALSAGAASQCDVLAGAFYDPERRAQGMQQERIDADMALPVCTALIPTRASARALYQAGRALIAKEDFPGARRNLELALSKGYKAASVDLALLLTDPSARMLDPTRAVSLYEQAWRQGVPIAGFELGALFEHGIPSSSGVGFEFAPDLANAWRWYQEAASRNEPNSLARFAQRAEKDAIAASSSKTDALLLEAFTLYARAAECARAEDWPDAAWRVWRYRRATLARVLADEGMMQQVADAYASVVRAESSARTRTFLETLRGYAH
jgi:WD40 repeat protein/TPR repeat protein